ncbi:MAG: iron chelate uptake ABC transporter family permease subunit, partial [Monoglobaceae bacterium]
MNNFMKSCKNKKIVLLYAAAITFLIVSFFLGIMLGSTSVSFADIWGTILNRNGIGSGARIFWYVRLPRIFACLVCGGALSVSGAVIQGVLANRLASPSILGVNSGAGLAVILCTAFEVYGGWQLSAFSFLGAFAAVMLVSIC